MTQVVEKRWTEQDYLDKSIEFVKQKRSDIFGGSKPGKEYMNFRKALKTYDKDLYEAGQ